MGSIDLVGLRGYQVKQEWHSKPTYLRVIAAGAGATGLCLAYKMKEKFKFENYDLVVYEKPAHAYTYSFEPNPNWSTFYAYGPEIRQYFEGFAKKHDLLPCVKVNSRITKAVWDDREGIYNVEISQDGQRIQDWCHVLVNGTGFLNDWKWPKIPGLTDFKGTLMHTANWDTSGISPPVGGEILQAEKQKEGDQQAPAQSVAAQYFYTEEEKQRFREDPKHLLEYRQGLEAPVNLLFDMFIAGSETSKQAEILMRKEMNRRIGEGHEELKAKLIPSWPPGCRRITPGDGYLEALVQPNVTTVHEEIQRHDVDILVCATGFNLAFTPPFEVYGKDGLSMHDFFNNDPYGGPQMYLATTVPHFPNFFVVNGVRGNWASGTALPSIEICCEYILRCCHKIQHDHLKSLEVKQEAVTQLYEHIDAWHEGSVWNSPCKSWYKNNIIGGKLWIWAGSALHFLKTLMGDPRYEHYNIEYKEKNMWSFLGNGRTKAEILKGTEGYATGQELLEKLTPYLRNEDCDFEVE
ncbi:hypothetical protein LTR24_004802 [Lithohypha guttulata]|uniref:FAD/NAD(P)-binding domain-containing protein n=1 Tax=Lithohypha guttulata TaxID=1690604 RepID=A0ABR0KCH4_9EURO|nr:hypothetical protein LTR24_004802 [Lithohypha guttulata]